MKNLLHIIIPGLLFLTLGVNTSFAQKCGPGKHWVDDCPGGADIMHTQALAGISLTSCDGPTTNLILEGSISVRRRASTDTVVSNACASARVDRHKAIPTEILSLSLTGGGYALIAGQAADLNLRRSLGAIVELRNDSTKACSFFNVFFKLVTPQGTTLYSHDTLRVQATIDSLPPLAVYEHITQCIALYDSPTGGTIRAYLVRALHVTTPIPDQPVAVNTTTRILNPFQGVYAENSQSVSISWQIPFESDNTFYLFERDDNFYIERSSDGVNFKKIGTTVRSGSANTTNYKFTDAYPVPLGYYRLQFISSGRLSYSQVIKVVSVTGGRLIISPNPSSGKIKLLLNNMQLSAVDVTVYDIYGHPVLSRRIGESGQPEINISGLSNGTYLLQCRQKGVIYQGKFVKK